MQQWNKYTNLGYFNLARGLGIVLILLGHSAVPFLNVSTGDASSLLSGMGSVLGGGVMAMFFLISGFGFYTRTPKKTRQIQNRLLLYPYYLVVLVMALARLALALLRGRSPLAVLAELALTLGIGLNAENASALFGEPVRSVTILWFILALYGGWLVYNRICRVKNEKWRLALVFLSVLTGWAMTLISKAWPMCAPMALIAAGYLAGGSRIRQDGLLDRPLPKKAWVAMICTVGVSCIWGGVDVGAGWFLLGPVDIAATFCIGYWLLRCYARFMELELHHPLLQTLERIGNRSVWVVFLHAVEKSLLPWYRLRALISSPLLCFLLCMLLRSILIWAAYRLLNRLRCELSKKRRKKFHVTC